MQEVTPQDMSEETPCISQVKQGIIPAAVLLEMLFRELVAARRSMVRTLEQVDKVLDVVKEQQKQ